MTRQFGKLRFVNANSLRSASRKRCKRLCVEYVITELITGPNEVLLCRVKMDSHPISGLVEEDTRV